MKAPVLAAIIFRILGIWFLVGGIYRLLTWPWLEHNAGLRHAVADLLSGGIIYAGTPLLVRLALSKIKE